MSKENKFLKKRSGTYLLAVFAVAALLCGSVQSARASAPDVDFTVQATSTQPSPIWVGQSFSIGLKSKVTPKDNHEEHLTTTNQAWYITSVAYSTDDNSWTNEWSGRQATASVANFFHITIAGGSGGSSGSTGSPITVGGSLTGTLGEGDQAGFYLITFESSAYASATVNGNEESGKINSTPGNTTQPVVKLNITYTGHVVGQATDDNKTPVTAKTQKVHAGWPIQLGAKVSPAMLAANYTEFTWSIDGAGGNGSAAINGGNTTIQNGKPVKSSIVPLKPGKDTNSTFPDPSNSPEILQSYYYTKNGSFNASVTATGASIPKAKTTFDVSKPKVKTKWTAKYLHSIYWHKDDHGHAILALKGNNGGNGGNGVGFAILQKPPSGFHGKFAYCQIYNGNEKWLRTIGSTWHPKRKGLDTDFPYPFSKIVKHNGEKYYRAVDAPEEPLNREYFISLSVKDHATMWLLYKSSKPGSIYVPIVSASWSWAGKLKYLSGYNLKVSGLQPTKPLPTITKSSTDTYPEWSQIAKPPDPSKHRLH